MSASKDEQIKLAREVTFNSLNIEKIESRAGPADHHSNNESFNLNTKSPNLNLMITPSVYDFPQGKIKQGDFDNYLDDSDGKFKYNSNREPLRKEVRKEAGRKPGGLGLDVLSGISNDVAGCLDESSALRSKSNTGRDQMRRNCAAGRSGSFASSMQNLTYARNPAMTPKSAFLNGALASHAQRSTGKFGKGTYSVSPAVTDPAKAIQNLNEQIQKLKKQLHQKEAEYARDKAIWDQKSELADRALDDMRRKMEGQKQQYIQMIKLNHDSPIRCSQSLFTSSRASVTDEQVQSEIRKQAERLAESLAKERTAAELLTLKAQADADTKLLKQHHDQTLSQKEQEMKALSGQIHQLKAELANMTKARQTSEEDKQACQAQLVKEQRTVEDTNASNRTLLDKMKQNQQMLDQLQAQIRALNADMETKRVESQGMRRQMESLQEKLKESLRGGKERIESLYGENRKLVENVEALKRELDGAREQVKALEGRVQVERQSAGLQTSTVVDEELAAQIESLRQMLAEKENQIESLMQTNEQAKSHFQTEIQKKDEIILCLTRELRIVQAAQTENLKAANKPGLSSRVSHNESDDRTDASAGAGLDYGEDRSRRSRRNWSKRAGLPEDDALRIKKAPSKKKPELIVDEVESRKESIVSFKDSTVSIAFVTQSKKSAVMEPPSFSQDLVGQQVTALQQKQLFGKIPGDMRKCFQPESAGLPQLKKLGAGKNLDGQKRQIAEMYEQILLNAPRHQEKATIKRESEGSDTSARFLSHNFSQNESKYNEVRPEMVDSLPQEEAPDTTEEFYQIAQNVPGDFKGADDSGEESRSSHKYNNGGWNDDRSYSQEPIEISSSHLQEPSKNDCTEIEVPVCEKSQNESSVQYPNNQTQGDLSIQSTNRHDVMAEIYHKQLQLLEQRVSTRGLLLQDDGDIRTDGAERKQLSKQQKRACSRNRVPDNGPIITMSTMTRNEDCMQYSESADVCRNRFNDLTSRQIAIQQQLETGPNHSNSIVLSDGFGSSDLQSNMLQDKSDFTRIIPNELTQYTRSHADSASNLPSSAVLPMSHNESVHFHQNFPYGNGALKDCGISEVALSQQNISMHRQARAQNHAQQFQEDQSLLMLIKEIHLDDSTMSQKQFLHQSQLLEKCLHIQGQKNTNVRPFAEHEQLSSMNSLSGQRFLSKGVEGDLESNEQIQEEFPSQSGAESVPQEFHEEQQEVLLTEGSATGNHERKRDLFDESRLFTFKKECPLPKSVKSYDVQVFLEDDACPNPFSSENVEPTNESLDEEEPQIHGSRQNLVGQADNRAAGSEKQPKTARSSEYRTDLKFLSVTPRSASKHTLNDSIEPKIGLDRVNLPRRSPMKNHFPENPSGLKSTNSSRHLGASSALGNDSSISAPQSATQRQLLFKGKQFQQKDDSKRAGTSITKVVASKVVQNVKVAETAGKQKLFKKQGSRSRISDTKRANAQSSKGAATAQACGLATQRSVSHLDRAKARHKQRTPSHGVSDFQSQLQQYTQKHGGLSAIRSEKALKQPPTADSGKNGKVSNSNSRNIDVRGKLISELSKDIQMMENLTRVQNLQSTKTTGAAPGHRKNWTGCKQPNSALGSQTKGAQPPSQPTASNCLLQRRKDFREVKAKGFRKFDLDSVGPADGAER